jgi:hypothetical protein
MSVALKKIPAKFAAGASLSAGVLLGDYTLCGLYFPAGWTAANISMQISFDDGATWVELNDAAGSAVVLGLPGPTTTQPSTYYSIDVRQPNITSVTMMKLRSGLVGAPVAQPNAPTVMVVGRRIYPTDLS